MAPAKTVRMSVVIAAVCAFCSCAATGRRTPPGMAFSDLGAYLDGRGPSIVAHRTPALQVALLEGGDIVYEKAFGFRDRATRAPAETGTIFQVASISKSVAAWGVLRLAQEGRVELDAPVIRYLRRWSLPASQFDPAGVTARRLLSHTAGLSVHGFPGVAPHERVPTIEESLSGDNDGRGKVSDARLVKLIAEPGASFSYSGGGYTLLQLLVEEVSGEEFASYMKTAVLLPCGMQSSSFSYETSMEVRLAKPYSALGIRLPNYLFAEVAAAGLYTTSGDLARLLVELYRTLRRGAGTVLGAERARLLAIPVAEVQEGVGVGLGYFIETTKRGTTVVSHSGSNRGWRSYYAMEIESGKGIVALANSDAASRSMAELSDLFHSVLR